MNGKEKGKKIRRYFAVENDDNGLIAFSGRLYIRGCSSRAAVLLPRTEVPSTEPPPPPCRRSRAKRRPVIVAARIRLMSFIIVSKPSSSDDYPDGDLFIPVG